MDNYAFLRVSIFCVNYIYFSVATAVGLEIDKVTKTSPIERIFPCHHNCYYCQLYVIVREYYLEVF